MFETWKEPTSYENMINQQTSAAADPIVTVRHELRRKTDREQNLIHFQ